jgi:hypothetical protein
MKTENEEKIEQMTNDVLYSVMKCFIERKAKEFDVDETDIYLKIDEQGKCVDTFVDVDNVYLDFKGSEHTS